MIRQFKQFIFCAFITLAIIGENKWLRLGLMFAAFFLAVFGHPYAGGGVIAFLLLCVGCSRVRIFS